jgi:hypothetical protein
METFVTHLKVDKQVVPLLSKSTYHKNFPSAIRELVSNAYDADALSVNITVSKDFSRIEVEDDGNGMTRDEFDYYCTIAGKKNDIALTRKYKRKRIGQFGIGFLSVFPFCEFLEITTSVENSEEVLSARIPSKKYFEGDSEIEVSSIPIEGRIVNNISLKAKHYTKISLINPTSSVKKYFSYPKTNERKTITKWKPIDKFKWDLQEDLPLAYKDGSLYSKYIKYKEPIGLSVLLNGKPLYRNDPGKSLLAQGEMKAGKIEYQYIITTDYNSIDPVEARGIKLRVNNVGIGKRTDFELKRSRGFSRLHWLSGEVLISDGIKEALNISRDNFITNIEVEEFLASVCEVLRKQAMVVEGIAEAEKELNSLMESDKLNIAKPREEIIKKNTEKLKRLGFTINEDLLVPKGALSHIVNPPISIDKQNRVVTLRNIESVSEDKLVVLNKKLKISYREWDYKDSEQPSCRRDGKGNIEINTTYPLFKSRQYGSVFTRFHLMLLLAKEEYSSSSELFENLMKQFLEEFKDIAK